MKTRTFFHMFIFQLCCNAGLTVQSVPFDSNTANGTLPEMIPQEVALLPIHADYGDAGLCVVPDPDENTTSKDVFAMNTCTNLWFTKLLIMSKLQNMLHENSRDDHSIRFGLSNASFKIMCALIKTFDRLVENVVNGLLGLVSVVIKSCASLFKIALTFTWTHTDYYRFSQHESASVAVNMSYRRNATLWESETIYDHQSIVIVDNKPVVIESATSLFEKHPTVSTLLIYLKGTLRVLRGSKRGLTTRSRVVLVGHGSEGSGVARLGGYGPEELARVVSGIENESGHLNTVSLIGCKLGQDLHFVMRLLQALRSFNVETKLHLHSSILSISPQGEIMTKDNGVWRNKDSSKTVIAELDRSGNLLTSAAPNRRGQVIPNYRGKPLYMQALEWPRHPQMFVPEDLRKKYTSIDCLEGLTWSLFFEENERRRAPNYILEDTQKHLKAIWLTEPKPKSENTPIKHITSIRDLLVEIRYNAREEAESDLYYVLNDCIYKVKRMTFDVTFVGKFMNPGHQDEIENFLSNFNNQKDQSSLRELRQGLKASKFNDFCRQTFQLQQCVYNCERWGHYFMAAVFSASVRNFRTFSLFLMSVIACEVGRAQGTDSPVCTAFVGDDHPMMIDDPWHEDDRRGFYGCTVEGSVEMAKRDRLVWLDQVVEKENALYAKSKQMMSDVDHDQQTELDIFGRVKVMNKYVFSSYLEFFRGTPEGKKLKRGCVTSSQENYN